MYTFFYNIKTLTLIIFFIIIVFLFFLIIKDIPSYTELKKYQPPNITRLYSPKGDILNEFAAEKRIYINYNEIPQNIINAFIAAEDSNFYSHYGIDIKSIGRALFQNIPYFFQKRRFVGGSTITQQVIKGLILSNERNIKRKIKEAILAYKIERIFSKEKILEIYLNQIYLGEKSFGIYVAAKKYFNKSLYELSIAETAILASLPKAPSKLNPYKNYKGIMIRRNWILSRMYKKHFINKKQTMLAIKEKIILNNSINNNNCENYYIDTVKQELTSFFSSHYLYNNGLLINTNINFKIQKAAEQSLKEGIERFDIKNSWRGTLIKINLKNNSKKKILKKLQLEASILFTINLKPALILKKNINELKILFKNGKTTLLKKHLIKKIIKNNSIIDNIQLGDIILLNKNNFITQTPELNGAIIILENRTGKILSMVGGYNIYISRFNRSINSYRQPGSIFKIFTFITALKNNNSLNQLVLDEYMEIHFNSKSNSWIPQNYKNKNMGYVTIRESFERSLNLSTIRLASSIGFTRINNLIKKYLIYDNHNLYYSSILGAKESTLLKITNAYSSICNNGILKQPKLIDSIYSANGKLIYTPKDIFCNDCIIKDFHLFNLPVFGYIGKVTTNSKTNYQILSLLEGVIKRGSAKGAFIQNISLAGKTGTTNNSYDVWFIGMTPDITIGIYLGHDKQKKIGNNITSSNLAIPIFNNIMKKIGYNNKIKFFIPNSINK